MQRIQPRARYPLVVGALVVTLLLASAFASSPATARSFATCTPSAYTNFTSKTSAQAVGNTHCDAGAPCYSFTIRLATQSGATLAQWTNPNPQCRSTVTGWP